MQDSGHVQRVEVVFTASTNAIRFVQAGASPASAKELTQVAEVNSPDGNSV